MKFIDYVCFKTAVVVGTGIHLYSLALKNDHFKGIFEDFVEGCYLQGGLKVLVPFALPYGVSYYSRKNAKKESETKIQKLEETIKNLSE